MVSPKKGFKSSDNKVEWSERVVAIERVTKVVTKTDVADIAAAAA